MEDIHLVCRESEKQITRFSVVNSVPVGCVNFMFTRVFSALTSKRF